MTTWILAQSRGFGPAAMKLAGDKRGVTTLEYCLIAALIAAVCVGSATTLGSAISGMFSNVSDSIEVHH